jgi:hypothetical protein
VQSLVVVLAVLLALASLTPTLAQPADAPTDCTEVMSSGNIFIGHDCGEFASVAISGRVVIRRPWSRTNRASRAARIRARRGGSEPSMATTPANEATPSSGTVTMFGIDISGGSKAGELDCKDFTYQEDAQDFFDAQGRSATNDPYGLDGQSIDDDGVPCESLPRRP